MLKGDIRVLQGIMFPISGYEPELHGGESNGNPMEHEMETNMKWQPRALNPKLQAHEAWSRNFAKTIFRQITYCAQRHLRLVFECLQIRIKGSRFRL